MITHTTTFGKTCTYSVPKRSVNEENILGMASGLLNKSINTANFILSVAEDLAFPDTLGPSLLTSHVS
jgi:hypothetical protein